MKSKNKQLELGSVYLGAKFIFGTEEILGESFGGRKPPYDGQILTVVGFQPKNKNNVVVREANGRESLNAVRDGRDRAETEGNVGGK